MGKLTFVLIAEAFISAMLWLSGISPLYSQFLQYFTPGTGIVVENFTAVGGNYTVAPQSSISYTSLLVFGAFGAAGIIITGFIASSVFGSSGGFSVIYTIPALIAFGLIVVLFSPIVTLSLLLLADTALSPFGWLLLGSFIILNGIGIIDFIRGGEM